MKTLANSSSIAIAQKLPSKPSLHLSDHRPDFCFSLRCRNDQVVPNLPFLKLMKNKGISPVRASKTKVDLDTADLPGQQNNELKIVRVKFQLQRKCKFGEQFFIVGDDPLFGSWDPSEAIPMAWSDGHIWTAETDIVAGKTIQFKFILKGRKGDIIWQPGSDRFIQTCEAVNEITVWEDWENAELQKIIEEQHYHQHSSEEPQLEEKPSISSSFKSTSRKKVRKNTNRKNEQPAANGPTRIGPNGKVTSTKNQETKVVERVEDGTVLVPEVSPSFLPDEESNSTEKI